MAKKERLPGILIISFIVLFSVLSLLLLSPPKAKQASTNKLEFSAERAFMHLSEIAKEPHSAGTPANDRVREYIYNYCVEMGLETTIQNETGLKLSPSYVLAGQAKNVVAKLKGTNSDKVIVIMGHYDSQPNTPGAADNGSAIVSMMETIRVLKEAEALQNDVLFLFTDIEEHGMLGAEAFVNLHPEFENVALVFNYEARGNHGVSFSFEVSDENGWIIREFAKAAKYPFANSLAYEIYNIMPNYTDFTKFKAKGVTGVNSAFIDGYANYHSMTDVSEGVCINSIQHHGEHMLSLVKHFGNQDLSQTKAKDVIYFNPIGNWLIIYSAALDIPLIALTVLLFVLMLSFGSMRRRISFKQVFAGFGFYLLTIVLALGFTWLLQKIILAAYPHYTNFYSSNYYNVNFYYLAIAGFGILAFLLVFSGLAKRFSRESLFAGAILVLVLLMIGVKVFLQTGAYFIYFPLIIALLVYLFVLLKDYRTTEHALPFGIAQILLLLPVLALWIPFVYLLFISFGLTLPFGGLAVLTLCFPFIIPSLPLIERAGKWIFPLIASLMILSGIIGGHSTSGSSAEKPLQTNLTYRVNLDKQEAFWMSGNKQLDEWNSKYIKDSKGDGVIDGNKNRKQRVWKNQAPIIMQSIGEVKLISDTIINNERKVKLLVIPDSLTNSVMMCFPKNTVITSLNGRITEEMELVDGRNTNINFYAPPSDGFMVAFSSPQIPEFEIRIVERKLGLPKSLLTIEMPDDMIHGPGRLSNTTQIKWTYKLMSIE